MAQRSDPFAGLAAFVAVAETGSFTAAAARLGISPSAVSQAVRALEERLGAPLFIRTTRRIGLSEAGLRLHAKVGPAAAEIVTAVESVAELTGEPSGLLRLTVPRMAVPLVVDPVLPVMRRRHSKVAIEIAVEDGLTDLPGRGFDAGIRIGEFVEQDMVAVALTRDIAWALVGSPGYLAHHGRPSVPEELAAHEAIRYRFPSSGAVYRWEFQRDGRAFSLDPPGQITVNDGALLVSLAKAGLGLSYVADIAVEAELAAGALVRLLEPFMPTSAGLYLYFPRHAQSQPKLRAFIDVAREVVRGQGRTPAASTAA